MEARVLDPCLAFNRLVSIDAHLWRGGSGVTRFEGIDHRYSDKGRSCNPHPHQPWANFSIMMMECMLETGRCHSVCTLWFSWRGEGEALADLLSMAI